MRVITLENSVIIGIKNVGDNYILQENESVSEVGEFGQIKQLDESFIDNTIIISQEYVPTNVEIAQMISDLQADLMIAGVI